jgi:hypothetical protein
MCASGRGDLRRTDIPILYLLTGRANPAPTISSSRAASTERDRRASSGQDPLCRVQPAHVSSSRPSRLFPKLDRYLRANFRQAEIAGEEANGTAGSRGPVSRGEALHGVVQSRAGRVPEAVVGTSGALGFARAAGRCGQCWGRRLRRLALPAHHQPHGRRLPAHPGRHRHAERKSALPRHGRVRIAGNLVPAGRTLLGDRAQRPGVAGPGVERLPRLRPPRTIAASRARPGPGAPSGSS